MANVRLTMNKIREIIRLYESGLSCRKIARALNISRTVVSRYAADFRAAGKTYSEVEDFSDTMLLELFDKTQNTAPKTYKQLSEQFEYFTKELKRTGVNLRVLWEEYKKKQPEGYGYSQFCHHYQIWRNNSDVTMHIEHK